jgi:hypothetical protein
MAVWGVISAATAGVTNFGGLLAVRFFLGFVEAVYFVSTPVPGIYELILIYPGWIAWMPLLP